MAEPSKNSANNAAPAPTNKPVTKKAEPKKPILRLGKVMSPSSKKAYLESRGQTPVTILVLKYVAIIFFAITWLFYFIIKADLDPKNTYLKLFAVSENTYLKHKNLNASQVDLSAAIKKSEAELVDYNNRLDKRHFFEHQAEISDIRSQSTVQWFDHIDDEGNLRMGVFDSLEKLAEFFNARTYNSTEGKDGKITGRQILSRNDVELSNISVDRDNANFSVSGSNIFGKIFFLNTEFVEMINAFPFFKNGELRNFSRQRVRGDEGMAFSLSVEIQQEGEEDAADERFVEFLDWQQENRRSQLETTLPVQPSTPSPTTPRPRTPRPTPTAETSSAVEPDQSSPDLQ